MEKFSVPSLTFTLILLIHSADSSTNPLIESSKLLDLLIRDYTFKSLRKHSIKTGVLRPVHLPSNYSGITVDTVRFRCGSLRRYGAQVKEFNVGVGTILQPCLERLLLVRQILGSHWSDIYYTNYDLSGYKLVSPVLGLLAYNAINNDFTNTSSSYEINLAAGKNPITVDFQNVSRSVERTFLNKPLCASFGLDGKVTLTGEVTPLVCAVKTHGHFGLVVTETRKEESGRSDGGGGEIKKGEKIRRWRSVVGGFVGSVVLGVLLLGLVLMAAVLAARKKKRRVKREEMERRAFEEEALRVSMVGHSRVFSASATRTLPAFMEHECVPN
ncbi:PREDICTED: uncharacterized protein LOC104818249 [Tarenaya hassleriana]|uniref:uncharacterized protein LOC104818249 n=1 Tax=Tarenaya hassleriana TaxID=28532 RepID=UPI00053C4FA4|nr:PREDICTED: uncharacterized protein LOC104818249 [Tarenaya hassleriana]